MAISKHDLDSQRRENDKTLSWIKSLAPFLAPPLRLLWRIGSFRRWAESSTGGRAGAISRLAKSGQHDAAADLAMEALKDYPRELSDRDTWPSESWWLMARMAAENLAAAENPEGMKDLIAIAKNGPTPFEGYSVAQTLLVFSQWKHRTGEQEEAFQFALSAAKADPTWAESSFLLGWLCLVQRRDGAREHLAQAVRTEPEILSRILEDPVCGRHPDITAHLERIVDEAGEHRPKK